MAMSVLLRNVAKTSAVSNILRNQSAAVRLSGHYSPLQNAARKEAGLVQKVTESLANKSKPLQRNMGLMSPTKHWTVERLLSLCLYGMIPAAIAMPGNVALDNAAIIGMLLHSHWGLESIVVDYVRPIIFGSTIPGLAKLLLNLITISAMGSLIYFNMNDVGFGQAVRNVWYLEPKGKKEQ